jgi:hypothetical protein
VKRKFVNNRRIRKGRKKLKVDLEVKWWKAKKERICKGGKNDPLKVRPFSLFILFRWSSNTIARLISLTASKQGQDGSILTLHGSCYQICMKYTSAECTVENS